MASTPWVAGLYADLLAYRPLDPRLAFPPLDDDQTRAPLLPGPPKMEWDEPQRSQANREVHLSLAIPEAETARLPLAPQQAEWDESQKWQKSTDWHWSQAEEDFGLQPILPVPAWDEVQWQRWTGSFAQLGDEPWQTLLAIPNTVRDETDAARRFDPSPVPQIAEESLSSSPPQPPSVLDDAAMTWRIAGSLAALVILDDFVMAPAGGGSSGSTPRGRSMRFGFSFPAFR